MSSNLSTVDSLQNLTIHYISYNLIKFSPIQHGQLLYLPNGTKNKILAKILCVSSVVDKLGIPLYQLILHYLINDHTFELNLSDVEIDTSISNSLRKCPKLRQLTLDGLNDTSLTKDMMKVFAGLKHMRSITMSNSAIVQSGLVAVVVECMQELEVLDLRGCSNFNDTCAQLMVGRLNKLRRLALSRTAIGLVGVQRAIEGREALLELLLTGCPKLQSEQSAVAQLIATGLPQLRILCADVAPAGEFYARNDCHCPRDRGDVAHATCKCAKPLQQITFTVSF